MLNSKMIFMVLMLIGASTAQAHNNVVQFVGKSDKLAICTQSADEDMKIQTVFKPVGVGGDRVPEIRQMLIDLCMRSADVSPLIKCVGHYDAAIANRKKLGKPISDDVNTIGRYLSRCQSAMTPKSEVVGEAEISVESGDTAI